MTYDASTPAGLGTGLGIGLHELPAGSESVRCQRPLSCGPRRDRRRRGGPAAAAVARDSGRSKKFYKHDEDRDRDLGPNNWAAAWRTVIPGRSRRGPSRGPGAAAARRRGASACGPGLRVPVSVSSPDPGPDRLVLAVPPPWHHRLHG